MMPVIKKKGAPCLHTPSRSYHRGVVLCTLLLALSLLPITNIFFTVGFAVAERVLYMPSIGSCAILARMMQILASRLSGHGFVSKGVVACLLIAWCASWSFGCLQQSRAWWTAESLYRSGIEANPNNEKLHDLLATRLQNSGGNLDEAWWHAKEAIRLNPQYWHAHATVGQLNSNAGKRSAAIASYQTAVSLAQAQKLDDVADAPKVRLNLAVQLQDVDRKAAEQHFHRLCSLPSSDPLRAMGLVIFGAFLESGARGQREPLEEAAYVYQEALRSEGLEQKSAAHLRLGSVIRRLALSLNQSLVAQEVQDNSSYWSGKIASFCSPKATTSGAQKSVPRSLIRWWQVVWKCAAGLTSETGWNSCGGKEMDLVKVESAAKNCSSSHWTDLLSKSWRLLLSCVTADDTPGGANLLKKCYSKKNMAVGHA